MYDNNNNNYNDTMKTMNNIFMATRIIRPIYLIYRSRAMNRLSKSLITAISSLFEIAIITLFFYFLFTMIGYSFFYDLNIVGMNTYFSSFSESLWSLFVLQTTCNFPNIMMKSYHDSQWTAIYFFIYNLFGM